MRIVIALFLMALPAQAEDCFSGLPKRLTFDSGKTTMIIQRHGESVTHTEPYVGGNDAVIKTHLFVFPKQIRLPNRMLEYRWDDRLPGLEDMVAGYHFDVQGTMRSGDDAPIDYRIVGDVLSEEVINLGECSYGTLVIASTSYVGGVEVVATTVHLSTEMLAVLRTEGQFKAGEKYVFKAVKLE